MPDQSSPLVGIIMGSQSDWETMRHASQMLEQLGIAHEARILSAHRTPDQLLEYAAAADRVQGGLTYWPNAPPSAAPSAAIPASTRHQSPNGMRASGCRRTAAGKSLT